MHLVVDFVMWFCYYFVVGWFWGKYKIMQSPWWKKNMGSLEANTNGNKKWAHTLHTTAPKWNTNAKQNWKYYIVVKYYNVFNMCVCLINSGKYTICTHKENSNDFFLPGRLRSWCENAKIAYIENVVKYIKTKKI